MKNFNISKLMKTYKRSKSRVLVFILRCMYCYNQEMNCSLHISTPSKHLGGKKQLITCVNAVVVIPKPKTIFSTMMRRCIHGRKMGNCHHHHTGICAHTNTYIDTYMQTHIYIHINTHHVNYSCYKRCVDFESACRLL